MQAQHKMFEAFGMIQGLQTGTNKQAFQLLNKLSKCKKKKKKYEYPGRKVTPKQRVIAINS